MMAAFARWSHPRPLAARHVHLYRHQLRCSLRWGFACLCVSALRALFAFYSPLDLALAQCLRYYLFTSPEVLRKLPTG